MQEAHRDAIRHNRLRLIREMSPLPVIQRLTQLNILTDIQCESIMAKPTAHEKNAAILDIVPRKGPKAFQKFCQALSASGGHHLRLLIEPQPPTWELSERTKLVLTVDGIRMQRGNRYVNIPFVSWVRLMEVIPEVQEVVNAWAKEEVKFPLQGGQCVVVSNFRENMYVGIHQVDQDTLVKGSGLNFNMEEMTVFLQVMDSINEELMCSKPQEPTPDTYQLIDVVYRSVLVIFKTRYGLKLLNVSSCSFI